MIKARTLGRMGDEDIKNKLNILRTKILNNDLSSQQREDLKKKFDNLYRMSFSGYHCYAVVG